jgi:hypothetical protein
MAADDDTTEWDPIELEDGPPWLTNRDKDEEPDLGFDVEPVGPWRLFRKP